MDSRTRFRHLMAYQPIDRVPWLEEGLRDDVFERWRSEGMPAEGPESVFTYDRRERIEVNLGLRPHGAKGVLKCEELPEWRRNLDRPIDERLGADWPDRCTRWAKRDHLLELPLHSGLFLTLGVGDWAGLEEGMYLLADEPEVVQEAMNLQGELSARVARRVLADTQPDLVSFSEPIGANHGPLVGPAHFRQFVLQTYAEALALVRAVPATVFITYANVRVLLPDVVAAGFNTLWAIETETTAMDYQAIRREFGKNLRLIGGIDLDTLLAGPPAVEHEIQTKLPALLAEGGFIPLADGRVRATIPWPAYRHYRQTLEHATTPAALEK